MNIATSGDFRPDPSMMKSPKKNTITPNTDRNWQEAFFSPI